MEFTHFNDKGYARMVDVSEKSETYRIAKATATINFNKQTYEAIVNGRVKKGDVLSVAQVAGIMAAKKNSELIPMCHPIMITGADVDFELVKEDYKVIITTTVKCKGETGVEMEALTAATVAALTIYDMCKALQRDIEITDIHLLEKSGGKNGNFKWQR